MHSMLIYISIVISIDIDVSGRVDKVLRVEFEQTNVDTQPLHMKFRRFQVTLNLINNIKCLNSCYKQAESC